jgi:hypothetical protein
MTQDQVLGLMHVVFAAVGTVLTAAGVSGHWSTDLLNLVSNVAGPGLLIATAIWSYIGNSPSAIAAKAQRLRLQGRG